MKCDRSHILRTGRGQDPLAGPIASCSATNAGFTACVLLTAADGLLYGVTAEAAHVIDPNFAVGPVSNPITPIYPYLPMIIGMAQEYNKDTGTIISLMLPYSVVFLLVWIVRLVVWSLFNLPLGPGAYVFL